jgi:uroporphyrinogen decarboxylase
MNSIERLRSALRGERPDRPPYGFWTHLPGIDLDPVRLVEETLGFAARYDLDFVKSMPNGLYCVEDWGCVADYSDIARGGVARVTRPAIETLADWRRLERVDVARGAFGRELDHLAQLTARAGVPVLATVFSPLTIAGKLSNGAHRRHLAEDPDAVLAGLEVIAAVTCDFTRAAMERGCAGAFFATQEASHGAMDEASYRRYAVPHDAQVLAAARAAGGWFNVLHMHGDDVMFDVLSVYDVTALNWHIGETPPSIADYRAAGGTRPIVGGLQRGHLTSRDLPAVRADIDRAMRETQGRGIVIAPACVIRHPVDEATLQATVSIIRGLGGA